MQATVQAVAEWSGAEGLSGRSASEGLLLTGVSTDTRTIKPGQLFVPLRGERYDGHDYIRTAAEAGAAASLWDSGLPVPDIDIPLILVADTLLALQALAVGYAGSLSAKVVAVTGSNGKTTTKDFVSAVLSTKYLVHKTDGNFNNHIGLPLTILRAPSNTEILVLEMGMSAKGEISLLSKMSRPDLAIITNIGESHLLHLGSRRNIAKAKLEIADGLKPGGTLFYYGDEPLLSEEIAANGELNKLKTVTFGENPGNDWNARYIRVTAEETHFSIAGEGDVSFALPVAGRHNAINALAAIAVGRHMGLTFDEIREGLASAKLTGMRIERSAAKNGALILNDAYNASPTSVKAAIHLVAELTGYRRKWIVLGDMLDLGPEEEAMHGGIGRGLNDAKADAVLLYGPLSKNTYSEAKSNFPEGNVLHFGEKEALADYLLERLEKDDLVLVKASRGMRMEEIVSILQKGARG
ncbi:UDP-N-acetylmuramoyl-tripeptide--D-alanyl-D-alanine ligase [Cohnella lupini]|uniref:UDP-N-acetylmuramoyl-tripeptide--D-alanyl-D-alanine ligase n=1 Tax=Cohnella lupini TaxID=1294267 RepID=A0A3D9IXE0_9BACL|nr:UDP-N-acetylmuramoyl-tripeptide--D-alanyl-D-alanine ligase [Cohnella lupini]